MVIIKSSEKTTKKKQIGTRDCVGEISERFFSQTYFYTSFNFNILFLHIHSVHNNRSYGQFRKTGFFFGALGAAQYKCAGWIRDRKELQGIFRSLRPNYLTVKIFQVWNYSLCHQVASAKN